MPKTEAEREAFELIMKIDFGRTIDFIVTHFRDIGVSQSDILTVLREKVMSLAQDKRKPDGE